MHRRTRIDKTESWIAVQCPWLSAPDCWR